MKRTGLVLGLILLALGAGQFAAWLWTWVLNFDPGFTFAHAPVPTGPPLSGGVTILLVDGLRLDASRRMDALNALRARGADIEGQVGTPSFSRPGRATVAVGAYPSIHGVTTNRQKRAIPLDNIVRRVAAAGGRCRVAGSKIWSSLFGQDIERCGVYREGESKEGPGAFVRQVGEVRASQDEGIAFILKEPAMLRIADIISTDFAAHEYGGTSPEYLAEVRGIDARLAELVSRLDLSRETLVVTADHGHRDAGGHGGEEAEVLAIPIVMAGAGIRPGTTAKASQADIAPTVAALLGVALPAASSGRPLESVLALDENQRTYLHAAAEAQREAFERAVGERLGLTADRGGNTDFDHLAFAQRDARKERSTPGLILAIVGLPSLVLGAIHVSRARAGAVGAGVAACVLALLGAIGPRIPAMSFSAINYDEMLLPFFERVMILAAILALVAVVAAAAADRFLKRREKNSSAADSAAAAGLIVSAALAVATACWWWNFDLLSPLTLPGPDRLVQAFSLTLALVSVSLTALAVVGVLWSAEVAGRARGTGGDSIPS